MKDKVILLEMLLEKVEEYVATSVELYKLKAIDKLTDVFASITSRIVIFVVISLSFLLLSLGACFYFGEILGKVYYGFFAVAGFYFVIAIIILLLRSQIEIAFNNYVINQIFKEKKNASN